jgi:AcrR family transcriptional regulator
VPDRRQALVDAAFRTIAERGFEGLRLRPVATEAGIDHSTLHHYFPTKDALIAAVLEHVTGGFEATMRSDLEPAERLRHHLRGIARAVREHPGLSTVLAELDLRAGRDDALRQTVERDQQGWRDALAALFDEGKQRGSWAGEIDTDASVELVIATLKGIRHEPATAEAVVEQLCDLFTNQSSTGG